MDWFINKLNDGEVVVTLKGKVGIDHEKLKQFEQEVSELIVDNIKLTIDCSDVEYINSFAIRTMVVLYKNVSAKQGIFEMVNVTDQIYELFDMLGLVEALNLTKK